MSAAFHIPEAQLEGLNVRQRALVEHSIREAKRDPAANARVIHCWDPFDDQQDLLRALDVREGKVKVAAIDCGRGYGKTKIIAETHLEVAEAFPGAKCLAASRSQEQSELALTEIRGLLASSRASASMVDEKGSRKSPHPFIRLKNGSTIHSRTTEDDAVSLRGSEFDFITLDEAAFVPEAVWHFLLTLVRKSNGPVLAFSTPGEDWFEDLFHKLEDRRRDGDESVLAWQAPASLNPHLAPDYFARARADMPEVFYNREILAQFVGGHIHTFRREHLEKIFDPRLAPSVPPIPGHRYGLGWDLAAEGDAVGLVADCTAPELVIGVHAEKHSQTVWPHVQARVEDTARKYPGRKAIDYTGVGKSAGQNLKVHVREEEKIIFTTTSRYELCVEAMKFVEDRAEKQIVSLALPAGGVWSEVRDDLRKHKLSMAKKRDSKSMGEIGGKTWDALDAFLLMVHAVNQQIKYRGSLVEFVQ